MVIILIKKNIKNNKTKNLLSNQKGIALLTTLIFVFILVTFGVALLTMTGNDIKLSALQRDSTKALYIAEAGIEKALWYLNITEDNGGEGLEWRTDNIESYPEGYFQEPYPAVSTNYYQLTVEDTAEQDIIKITSRGVVFNGNKIYGSRKIEVKAKKAICPSHTSPSSVYKYAISTEGNLTFSGIVEIDGDVHSNGNISAGEEVLLTTGVATASGGTNELGSANYATQLYPKIDFEYYKGLAIANDTYYVDLKVFDIEETITGIHFIEGDVEIKSSADLEIIDGAIFATGTITVISTPKIRRTQTAGYDNPLAIIAKGDITLLGNFRVEGIVQTEGELKIRSVQFLIEVYNGAVIADIIVNLEGSGVYGIDISHDPNLSVRNIIGTGIEIYKIISWQEIN